MAVYFFTDDAKGLLAKFNAAIKQTESKGKITTWVISDDGNYYTHKAPDWNKKAWFKPITASDRLTFNIIKPKNSTIKSTTYGYYHGHLIETFLNHFDKSFSTGCASALAASDDNCG